MTSARSLADRLAGFLREDLGHSGPIPLHSPELGEREKAYLVECIDTGWVSSAGPFVDRLEAAVAARCDVRYAVATVSGTAALHAALLGLGVGRGDAVVVPALSFIATANAVAYTGAAPIFADIEPTTLGLCPKGLARFLERDCHVADGKLVHIATGRRIAAVIPVHLFGNPVNFDAIDAVARSYGLPVVEDAAEALGSIWQNRPCGSLGTVGALSFNGNKVVTAGGGGMLLVNDPALARRLRHMTTTARVAETALYDHDEIGFNYRLPNVNAALALAQLDALDDFLARKHELAARYAALFAGLEGITVVRGASNARSNHWLTALLMHDPALVPAFVAACEARGIAVRPAWRPLPDTGAHADAVVTDDLDVARRLAPRLVNLPSSSWLLPATASVHG